MDLSKISSLANLPSDLPKGVYLCDVAFTPDADRDYTGQVRVTVPDGSTLDERWTVNAVGAGDGVPTKVLVDTRPHHFTHEWHENLWSRTTRLVDTLWFAETGHVLSVEFTTRDQYR